MLIVSLRGVIDFQGQSSGTNRFSFSLTSGLVECIKEAKISVSVEA